MGVSDRAGRCTAASIVLACVLVALIGCAPPPEGPSAPVRRQVLWVDGSGAALRRTVAFQLALGDDHAPPIDLVSAPWGFERPDGWLAAYSDYFWIPWQAPTAAEVRTALEALPSVGPGAVTVDGPTALDGGLGYVITFDDAQPMLDVVGCWTILPQEQLPVLLARIDAIAEEQVTAPPTTVPSPYADVDEWISALRSQAVQAAIAGDRELAEALTAQADDLQLRLDVSHDADHVRARTRAAFVTCPSVRAG